MRKLVAAVAALAMLLPGCSRYPPPATAGSAAPPPGLQDPPRDEAHPASNRQLVIPSGPVMPELGRPAEMNALFFLAAGEGPKPTMLLLHGLPGNERNLDLAQAVRRAGWNVLTITYRGAWGSEGRFSIENAVADAAAALAFLRTPGTAARYDIDPRRLVVAGHSMGGFAAAATAAADPNLAGLVMLDAWDIAATARETRASGAEGRAAFVAGFDDIGHSLGPVTAADLADEVIRGGERWDLPALAPRLAKLPVLTVYATHGGAAENRAVAAAIAREGGGRITARELSTDHAFADHRVALAAEVVAWLRALPPAGD
jgi:pimeloyl-ACP methyl ester carboxylesterase